MARWGDRLFGGLTGLAAAAVVASFLALLWILVDRSAPTWFRFGPGFLWGTAWDPPAANFGALPYIFGTAASSLLALLFAVPMALGAGVALAMLLPRPAAAVIGLLVELLAAIPSIILGVWGMGHVVPFVRDISRGTSYGRSLLAAGIILAIMVLPIITAVARDMIKAVPQSQREAALALGLTRWEVVWKVVLPYARPGILAAVLLGFGRAVGETMAVILVIGNQPILHLDVFAPAATMASTIANQFGDPSGPLHASSLVALGLVMMLMSLTASLIGRSIVRRARRHSA
jgi:phosphate transport system permease protein